MVTAIKVLSVLCLLLLSVACSENETAPNLNDPNRQPLGTFRADVNGIAYETTAAADINARVNNTTGVLEIIIIDQDRLITFNLAGGSLERTHELGPGKQSSFIYRLQQSNTISYSSAVAGASGKVTVAYVGPSNITGTFNGVLVNTQNAADVLQVANGVFNLARTD